ncbi:4-hydroxybenzoyl-CoA thioesterase [Collimonas sp. PA-H2]|uniref:acyl-CoA thioesterase n=1 Tax=Collimonas sp. PA-H2 TaxID=1881062 RepID=UPI000BF95A7F|nr:thioesterase family protein [Collimonas sp. PA-H2]PFH09045.1 4-hydroxybenzoyl-CoA thioesterase [Collimonas sp. PA-H2]
MTAATAYTCLKEIRFHHCDPAGIVFYPQYFVLFHELIEDWFNDGLNISYSEMIAIHRKGIPTVRLECDFLAPSRLGDVLTMQLNVARLGESSLRVKLSASHLGKKRIAATQTVVLISLETMRPMPLPEDYIFRMTPFVSE